MTQDPAPSTSQPGINRFTYDVGVNVVANLMSALIVYVALALLGVLPVHQGLIAFIFAVVCYLAVSALDLVGRRSQVTTWISGALFALAVGLFSYGIVVTKLGSTVAGFFFLGGSVLGVLGLWANDWKPLGPRFLVERVGNTIF